MEIRTKKDIRSDVKAKRKEASSDEIHKKSQKIFESFVSLKEYQDAAAVLAYVDCKNEVETSQVIRQCWKEGKIVAVPKVFGKIMKFYEIHSFEDLEEGYYGIREPKHEGLKEIDRPDAVMILPGVAFDKKKHRVGYGGGFYDRYLEEHPDLTKIAFAFEFQIYDCVPHEVFDIQPEKIVTEKRIII